MITSPINKSTQQVLTDAFAALETILDADVKQIIEQICHDGNKHEKSVLSVPIVLRVLCKNRWCISR